MKTALTIDGNYLLMKDVFILHYMKSLYVDLDQLLRNDVNKLMKLYPFDKVYFVSDSKDGYWRKDLMQTYKSTRKKDDAIDWAWVFERYDELKEELQHNNKIEFIEISKCEGDDVIAYITNEGNKKGYSNFIMASDSDLQQLLRFDTHNDYINIIYNFKYSDEKTYLPENYNVYINHKDDTEISIFDMDESFEFLSFLKDIMQKTTVNEIDTEKLLFCKLVSGDKKDAIPSVYIKNNRGIGKKGGETIYDLYKEMDDSKIDFDSDEFTQKLTDVVKFNKKITSDMEDAKDITESIKNSIELNKKLTILKSNYLPSEIYDEMKKTINF